MAKYNISIKREERERPNKETWRRRNWVMKSRCTWRGASEWTLKLSYWESKQIVIWLVRLSKGISFKTFNVRCSEWMRLAIKNKEKEGNFEETIRKRVDIIWEIVVRGSWREIKRLGRERVL